MICTRSIARVLHMITPRPLERMCWRRSAALWGDCKKSGIAPFSAIINLLSLLLLLLLLSLLSIEYHWCDLAGESRVRSSCLLLTRQMPYHYATDGVSHKQQLLNLYTVKHNNWHLKGIPTNRCWQFCEPCIIQLHSNWCLKGIHINKFW